jgi:hypothetical protein
MNNRIRELYEQARLHAKSIDADLDPQGWMDLYHQKFAELIVKECADAVLGFRNQFGDSAYAEIKQHFGVES